MELSISNAQEEFLKELENPTSVKDEIKYQQDNFSKLKFQYLEQETRDKFLRNLLNNDINGLINNDELVKRQHENGEIKTRLKHLKKTMNGKQADINTISERILQQYHQYHEQLQKNDSLLSDITDLEKKIADIDKELDFNIDLEVEDPQTNPDEITEVSDYVNYYHEQVKHTQQIDGQISNELYNKSLTVTEKRLLIETLTARLLELKQNIANKAVSGDTEGEYNDLGKWILEINNLLSKFVNTSIDYQLNSHQFQMTINGSYKLVFDINNFMLVDNNFGLDQGTFNLSNDKFRSLLEIIINIDQYELK